MIIEPIRPEHRDAFRALLGAFFQHANNPWPGNDAFEEFFERITGGSPRLVFLGAFDGGALVGIASVALVESSFQFRPFAYLDDLFVTPEARGRGAGARLIEQVKRVAATWGASSVLLGVGDDEAGPRAFYERAGFRDMGNRLFFTPL